MFMCHRPQPALPKCQFASSQELEALLKKCTERANAIISDLESNMDKGADLSMGQQHAMTHVFAVLSSLPAHAELAKSRRVQKQACELCTWLVVGIKRISNKQSLFKKFDTHVGAQLAQVLVDELYRPQRTVFPLHDLLCIFGDLCLVSPTTRALAVERSVSHQIAGLCSPDEDREAVQQQAHIALCKLLVGVGHYVFESCFVDLLMNKTIKAPGDVKCTSWVLTVLSTMQENNERALDYIWKQSPVSPLIVNVLSSNPCSQNTGSIMRLLRFAVSKTELRVLLARSGVWEVLHQIVMQPDVNNMTLQRFAEVFQHFAECPATGPVLVGVEAHHTLISALEHVKDADTPTFDKLLSCVYSCCKNNPAFGANFNRLGHLHKMHEMCIGVHLPTLSILFAGYAVTCDGHDMQHILAQEVLVLTYMLRGNKSLPGISTNKQDFFVQMWVRFVHNVRASDIRALGSEVVQEFATAVLGNSQAMNMCMAPALHLLARMVLCRGDVVVPAQAVRTVAKHALVYTSAALCTGLLVLVRSVLISVSNAAAVEPGGASTGANAGADGTGGSGVVSWTSADALVGGTSTSGFEDATDKDTESDHSTDGTEGDVLVHNVALTQDNFQRIQHAFANNIEVLGALLCVSPEYSPTRLKPLCDMFVAAFKGRPSQCLLAMDVIDALLPWHDHFALKVACNCGLHQLWKTVEKRMYHCGEQTSVQYIETFARACLLASKTHKQQVLDSLLGRPFFCGLLAHMQRAVSAHEMQLARALVGALHTVLDVQPDAGAVLLLGGATLKLVGVRDVLAAEAGMDARLHAEIGTLLQRLVPQQHAALLASFEQPRKRKLQECLRGESV